MNSPYRTEATSVIEGRHVLEAFGDMLKKAQHHAISFKHALVGWTSLHTQDEIKNARDALDAYAITLRKTNLDASITIFQSSLESSREILGLLRYLEKYVKVYDGKVYNLLTVAYGAKLKIEMSEEEWFEQKRKDQEQ